MEIRRAKETVVFTEEEANALVYVNQLLETLAKNTYTDELLDLTQNASENLRLLLCTNTDDVSIVYRTDNDIRLKSFNTLLD